MIILSIGGDIATILEAAFTFGLLLLAYFALFKKDKIKGFSKLLSEKQRENDINSERLRVEKERAIKEEKKQLFESRPRFKLDHIRRHQPNRIELVLINDGADAMEIMVEGGAPDGANWNAFPSSGNRTKTGAAYAIMVTSGAEFEGISFELVYKNASDNSFSQRIYKEIRSDFKIERVSPPE